MISSLGFVPINCIASIIFLFRIMGQKYSGDLCGGYPKLYPIYPKNKITT
ncbi:hypothetical protein M949_0111 [Riemerella anatipestifer CH3]|nr:hypothetical protein M949_0111 [Riemerella anatipestifer CH3]